MPTLEQPQAALGNLTNTSQLTPAMPAGITTYVEDEIWQTKKETSPKVKKAVPFALEQQVMEMEKLVSQLSNENYSLRMHSITKDILIKEFNKFLKKIGSHVSIGAGDKHYLTRFFDEIWKKLPGEGPDVLPE